MEASTPEALNAQLLARIVELEREVADLRARVAKGRQHCRASTISGVFGGLPVGPW